jgi:hypothetical protein
MLVGVASAGLEEVEARFVAESGQVITTLGKVDAAEVVHGRPVRTIPAYGQRSRPGVLWVATTGTHVPYESLLERDRLLMADFDPVVRGIAVQPLALSGRDGQTLRRHVPDMLLERADGTYLLVDVKPARLCSMPDAAAVLNWTGRLCADKGWGYEVWSGADPVLLGNLRFLAGFRRRRYLDEVALHGTVRAARTGMTIVELEAMSGMDPAEARAAVLALLWAGSLTTDLARPLSPASVLQVDEPASA